MKAEGMQWHFVVNGERQGPVIGRSLSTSQVNPNTLVWCRGMAEWKAAKNTPLSDLLFGVPPPFSASLEISGAEPKESPPELPHTRHLCVNLNSDVQPSKNYISRHWRGDTSLAQAYWVNVLSVTVLLNLLLLGIPFLNLGLQLLMFTAITSFIFVYAVVVWQLVGLLRSLKKHISRGGTVSGLIIGWIGLGVFALTTFVHFKSSVVPLTGEAIKILRGDTEQGSLKIELLPSGTEAAISGCINAGSAAAFSDFIATAPQVISLHINSFGGRAYEAKAIAEQVAKHKISTLVTGQCLSAATIIFLSGYERHALPDAKIGFHAGTSLGMSDKDILNANQEIGRWMRTVGVSKEFVAKAINTANTEMWYPSMEEMLNAGVLTAPKADGRFDKPNTTTHSRYIRLKLPLKVSVEVPKNWFILSGDVNASIEAAGEALSKLAGYDLPIGSKVNLLRANAMPSTTYASIAVNATEYDISLDELTSLSGMELKALEQQTSLSMRKSFVGQQNEFLEWLGLERKSVSGHAALVFAYRRSGPDGPVTVSMTQLFVGTKIFSFILSYKESEGSLWKPIIEYMRQSIRVEK